jgi:hypothetical protein
MRLWAVELLALLAHAVEPAMTLLRRIDLFCLPKMGAI